MKAPTSQRHTANMSVKLDSEERDRIKAIATAENRSPHFIMKEAILSYLEKKETDRCFIDVAKESRAHYKATGIHITHEEFSKWVSDLKNNIKTTMPICHS